LKAQNGGGAMSGEVGEKASKSGGQKNKKKGWQVPTLPIKSHRIRTKDRWG